MISLDPSKKRVALRRLVRSPGVSTKAASHSEVALRYLGFCYLN